MKFNLLLIYVVSIVHGFFIALLAMPLSRESATVNAFPENLRAAAYEKYAVQFSNPEHEVVVLTWNRKVYGYPLDVICFDSCVGRYSWYAKVHIDTFLMNSVFFSIPVFAMLWVGCFIVRRRQNKRMKTDQ